MKIVFVSNFMSHHQLSVSQEFLKYGDYVFVATEPFNKGQVSVGYKDMNKEYDFIICSYESGDMYKCAIDKINDADVVIYGSCPFEMVKQRIEDNKLTFRYSERLFKNHKAVRMFYPKYVKKIRSECSKYKDNNYYLLCASAYAAKDYAWFGAFKDKCLKWGYFPKIENINNVEKVVKDKQTSNNILWCGRFIDWKHPEFVIKCAKYLRNNDVNFKIRMIGTGPLEQKMNQLVKRNNLGQYVELVGALPFDKVQDEMKKSKVFLFTSDQNEGWGAVLNESMGNACCVVANKKIGSVPFVVKEGYNGFTYKNKKEFLKNVLYCCQTDISDVCNNAYNSIHKIWNAENAVNNFINYINKKGIESGPCSSVTEKM